MVHRIEARPAPKISATKDAAIKSNVGFLEAFVNKIVDLQA